MIITLTCLTFREGTDGAEDAIVKKPALVNTDYIEQAINAELIRKIAIIGEDNKSEATQILFRSGRDMFVMETVEEIQNKYDGYFGDVPDEAESSGADTAKLAYQKLVAEKQEEATV